MPRIYVDLDDVLGQTARMFLRLLEQTWGRVVVFEEMHTFHLGESLRLPPDELEDFLHRVHQRDALASVKPMPGAAAALAEWRAQGYEVWVVTGRPPETRAATLEWLETHQMSHAEFHFLDKYSDFYDQADTPEGTLTLADLPALDFRLAVEDFPGMAGHLADELDIPVALFDRPWNRSFEYQARDGRAPVVRCDGWAGIRARFPQP